MGNFGCDHIWAECLGGVYIAAGGFLYFLPTPRGFILQVFFKKFARNTVINPRAALIM